MSLVEPGKEPSPREVKSLLNCALAVSPLNPTARLALAQLEQAGRLPDHFPARAGLESRRRSASRGAPAGSWRPATKKTLSEMYTTALSVAIENGPARAAPPHYNNDPQAPRYLLPGEELRA